MKKISRRSFLKASAVLGRSCTDRLRRLFRFHQHCSIYQHRSIRQHCSSQR